MVVNCEILISSGIKNKQKCLLRGSNSRPWDYETHALPTAPKKQYMNMTE